MTRENRLRSGFEYMASTFGVVLFATYWGVIATFPGFYFVNPLADEPLRAASLFLLITGWISISTVAPILLFQYGAGRYRVITLLPYFVSIWPLAIFLSQLERLFSTGSTYITYLVDTPLFLVTDLIIPMALLALWLRLRLQKQE